MAFCGKCGTQLKDGVKFCPKCGQQAIGFSVNQNSETNNVYVKPKENQMKKLVIIVAVSIITIIAIYAATGGCSNTGGSLNYSVKEERGSIENTVKQIMIKTMREKGNSLNITNLSLVHQGGNNYEGIAEGTIDGKKMQWDVYAIYDGANVKAEWQPTAEYIQKENNRIIEEQQRESDRMLKEYQKEQERYLEELEMIQQQSEMQMRANEWNEPY